MAKSYQGMDPTYFVGVQSVFKCTPADMLEHQINDIDVCTTLGPYAMASGSDSAASGSSSNTATQMISMDQAEDGALDMMAAAAHQAVLPLLDRPLPIRKRQRKPNRKTMQTEADNPAVTSPLGKWGRKPKAAGVKPETSPASNVAEGDIVAKLQKRLDVKAPPNPPMLRELPPRNTPKKFWADEEVEVGAWWGKRGGAAQAMAEEEEEHTDYSPSPTRKAKASGPKKTKLAQEGRPVYPNRKKEGGPCALCFATKSATWRRGAQGRPHAGLPLCNKCGVWEFRHPDSPPRGFIDEAGLEGRLQQQGGQQGSQQGGQQRASSRRRGSGARGALKDHLRATSEQPLLPLPHEEATTSAHAQADMPMFSSTAVNAAATAAAAAPNSRMQPWEGNSLVGRVPSAAQNSMMQPWAQSGLAHTASMTDDDSTLGQGVQQSRVGGAKLSRKRSAEKSDMQPATKRWQIDASVDGSASKKNTLWEIANAARVSRGGRSSMEATQVEVGVAEQGMAFHTKSVLNSAAMSQEYMRMDECGHVVIQ